MDVLKANRLKLIAHCCPFSFCFALEKGSVNKGVGKKPKEIISCLKYSLSPCGKLWVQLMHLFQHLRNKSGLVRLLHSSCLLFLFLSFTLHFGFCHPLLAV